MPSRKRESRYFEESSGGLKSGTPTKVGQAPSPAVDALVGINAGPGGPARTRGSAPLTLTHDIRKTTESKYSTFYCFLYFFLPTSGRGSGTKPSRLGIRIFASVLASSTSFSPMIPFMENINATKE